MYNLKKYVAKKSIIYNILTVKTLEKKNYVVIYLKFAKTILCFQFVLYNNLFKFQLKF